MAAKVDNADSLATCPICFEQFINPKCLPCLHTFCLQCLKSYITTQLGEESKKAKEFPCPVCRQVVSFTDPTLTTEKIVGTISNYLNEKSGLSVTMQDETRCGPCNFRNKETFAISWCKNCKETLCENCAYYHEGFKQSKHEIIPIENLKKDKSVELLDEDEPCMKHSGRFLEVYCFDHKEMCCVICLATLHRKCMNISSFEEIVTGSKYQESMSQFADCLTDIQEKVAGLRITTEENISLLNTRHDEISQEVTTTVQQVKDKLDNLQSSFLTKLQHMHTQESGKLTDRKNRIELLQKNMKKGQKLLKVMQEKGSPKQIFITKEKLKLQLKEHIEGLKAELDVGHCIDYTLNIDDIVIYVLNALTSVAGADVKSNTNLDVVDNLYIEQEEDVIKDHIIHPGGEITGGTFLSDGKIVICCYKNKTLQVFNKSWSYLFGTDCEDGPMDACLISATDFAVSFSDQKYLKAYGIQEKAIKELRKIPCKMGPSGLAATKDNIIIGYSNQIDVLTMDGRVLRNFSRKGEKVSCVAVSMTGNIYYNDGNYIVCKTVDGKELRRFTSPNLRGLTGIAVDRCGNVYACGFRSYTVCKFSPDGHKCKVLVSDVAFPLNIGLDVTENNIFIATLREGCHLYRLRF